MKQTMLWMLGLCMAILPTGSQAMGNTTPAVNAASVDEVAVNAMPADAVVDETTKSAVCDTIFMTWTAEAGVEKPLSIEIKAPEAWGGGETFWVTFGDGTELHSYALSDTAFTKTYTEAGSYNVTITVSQPEVRITSFNCFDYNAGTDNGVTGLDVSGCTALKVLGCSNNRLTSLYVGTCTALTQLGCNDNPLSSLDVSRNTVLTTLHCANTQLTSLDVTRNTALVKLQCSYNGLTSLDVSQNTALMWLECYNTQLTSLDVSRNPALKELQCFDNSRVVDLGVDNGFDLSTLLGMDVSRIGGVTGGRLEGSRLIFEANEVSYYYKTHFQGEVALALDSVWFKLVASVPLTPVAPDEPTDPTDAVCDTIFMTWTAEAGEEKALRVQLSGWNDSGQTFWVDFGDGTRLHSSYLSTEDTSFTKIYTEAGTYAVIMVTEPGIRISKFICAGNYNSRDGGVTLLDVSTCAALEYLSCADNQLQTLNVINNSALKYLYCGNNQLATLDVTENLALWSLYCWGNRLSNLDVSRNVNLKVLDCERNRLEKLELSPDMPLSSLYCTGNHLTSLEVLPTLILLSCSSNHLTILDVSKNEKLLRLNFANNHIPLSAIPAIRGYGRDTSLVNDKETWPNAEHWYGSPQRIFVTLRMQEILDLTSEIMLNEEFTQIDFGSVQSNVYEFIEGKLMFCQPGEYEIVMRNQNVKSMLNGVVSPLEVFYKITVTDEPIVDPTEPTEPAVCDTIFMTWTAEAKWMKWIAFNSTAGETITVDWGDGSDTTVIGKGGQYTYTGFDHDLWHQYVETGSYQVRVSATSPKGYITHFSCSNMYVNNGVTSLDVIRNRALAGLYCENNQLTSLDVTRNTALTELFCHNNLLTSLDLSRNVALTDLYCDNNQLVYLDLSGCESLAYFYCTNNKLSSLDVSGCGKLHWLRCTHNRLGSLDVSHNLELWQFLCDNNQLQSLDVSRNMILEEFTCSNNQLSSLDVSQNAALKLLWCGGNQLPSLDVTHNLQLEALYCNDNQLASLDVTHNLQLEELACQRNRLTGLDVSHNDSLTLLSCVGNRLASLDVVHNPGLRQLNCSKNQLREILVSDTAFFHQVTCDSNLLPLSVLATLRVDTSAGNGACLSPQDIAVDLETGQVLDLRREMRLGNTETDYTVQKDGELLSDTAFYTMTAGGINGRLMFKVPGFYRLRLSNAAVTETHSYDSVWYNGWGYDELQPVYVYYNITVTGDPTDPTVPSDTLVPENGAGWIWLASAGEEKEIEFKGTGKGFRVDWGDGNVSEAKGGAAPDADGAASTSASASKDSEKALTHRYAEEGVYTVTLAPLSQNGRLTDLDVSDGRVLALAFGDASMLETLDCSDNLLAALDLSGCAALQEADFSDNRLTSVSLPTHASLKDVEGEDNRMRLSSLYGLLSGRVKNASYGFDPQSDSVTVAENAVLDLASEMTIGGRATTYTLSDAATRRPAPASDYAAEGGLFRFFKPGARYLLTLRNANVTDYEKGRADDMVAFTYHVYVSGVGNEDWASDEAVSAPWAYVQGRTIYLTEPVGGAGLGEVEAFTAVGQRVYRGHDRSFTVPTAGIYVLRAADGRRCKVMVG